ncbi:MAG TPA: amidohydrolase [Actinomycetes bacterium]|nr:amidohydrolase [Actinomycetes bacterium]
MSNNGAVSKAYVNGTIFTADPNRVWAHAFGVRGNQIVAVGSDDEVIAEMGSDAEVCDLNATLVTPGFVDGHFHLLMTGEAQLRVDLVHAKNVAEIQTLVKAHAERHPHAPWVLGKSWLFEAIPGQTPTATMLDEVVADRPVLLDANDYHSAWVNTAGLRALGVTAETADPAGGRIDRDENGHATGFLEETAADQIAWAHLEHITDDSQRLDHLRAAIEGLNSSGITSVIDMGLNAAALRAMVVAESEGWLDVRVVGHWLMSREGSTDDHLAQVAEAARLFKEHQSERLRVTGIKFIVDGVIDGCTAHVKEPYANGTLAAPIWDYGALAPVVAAADAAGLQCALHAIGDAAVKTALDVIENASRVNESSGRRHRIEHIEYLDEADVPRFAQLGVTASMQPVHCDPAIQANWRQMLGEPRAARGYPSRELVDAGARVVLGTDAPTAPYAPLPNLFIATTRRSAFDPSLPANVPEFSLPLDDAIGYATANAAWSCFAEGDRGRIAPGMLADFVLMEPDVLASDPEVLLRAKILLTVVDGVQVYRAE